MGEGVALWTFFFFKYYYFILFIFIYLFLLAALGLCCARAFSHCGEQGLLFVNSAHSHCGGFSCCGAQALGMKVSVVVACGLSSCGSRDLERRFSSCGAQA